MKADTEQTQDQEAIKTIRMLAIDAVEKARSGHPGMPLGAAPMAYVLWTRFLNHHPGNPSWLNRDRFILSAGHGSALLYALLHLSGYDLSLEQLQQFRQWGSQTPGHPEYGCAPGVEVTTGPLGQGFAMGVGMALAERLLAARYNRDGLPLVDHHTYTIVSDGDLMEGIASEAASIAGHQRLGKLIALYDDNHISIEGDTALTFSENVCERFSAYGWHTQRVEDGNDLDAIEAALRSAHEEEGRPSLIAVRTHIGFGSPKQDHASSHGEPLGEEAMRATKAFYGCSSREPFHVASDVRQHMQQVMRRGEEAEMAWQKLFAEYRALHAEEANRFLQEMEGRLPQDWDAGIMPVENNKPMATREASGRVMNILAERIPNLMGGSADLGPSNKTLLQGVGDCSSEMPEGRNLHFGVREQAMGAITNGLALHGGVVPYAGTFLIFSDYMRPTLRLAALMKAPSIFIFTHDSIGVGEDGPTHQPIEQVMSLRAIPGLTVIRPADAHETAFAWREALRRKEPVALMLTRQKVPTFEQTATLADEGVSRGAYILSGSTGVPDLILLATGSEVQLALEAQMQLEEEGVSTRVVSMPSWELFEEQPQAYRDQVLPPLIRSRVAIEAGVRMGWHRWVGDAGAVIGIDHFGASAPGEVLMEKFGFTVEAVLKVAREVVGRGALASS